MPLHDLEEAKTEATLREWAGARTDPAGEEPPRPRLITQTGLMEIGCDVHKWMRAYVFVHTNPYLGVTGRYGSLTIAEIPPGKHPYVAWHEQLGEKKGEVEIPPGRTVELRLEFAAPQ